MSDSAENGSKGPCCVKKFLSNPFNKQFLFGSTSGWLTGVVITKIGKTAAFATGVSILTLQIMQQKGYINLDWRKVAKKTEEHLEAEIQVYENKFKIVCKEIRKIAQENKVFAVGFIGGMFIGLSYK